jgi:hypothetical protein
VNLRNVTQKIALQVPRAGRYESIVRGDTILLRGRKIEVSPATWSSQDPLALRPFGFFVGKRSTSVGGESNL